MSADFLRSVTIINLKDLRVDLYTKREGEEIYLALNFGAKAVYGLREYKISIHEVAIAALHMQSLVSTIRRKVTDYELFALLPLLMRASTALAPQEREAILINRERLKRLARDLYYHAEHCIGELLLDDNLPQPK